ncbi:glycoside hydrolase family 76 protein [Parapedobacter soli]|uniref:glycoside hydrolase family 76 protein n=1 Tax=Parapedobacter soli TaxID=416955 RepID=UPI0021C657F0|nr:glycoside hydrolase family 76 protein [Parapedobacter soli]
MNIPIALLCLLILTASTTHTKHPIKDRPSTSKGVFHAKHTIAEQNLLRAIELADDAFERYFTGDDFAMARFYNPYTGARSEEKGSVWMYTAAIESVNAILRALHTHAEQQDTDLYSTHAKRYRDLLGRLYDNLAYYRGTFELTSYTQTREWTVYGVHRATTKGSAKVAGIENVYDDQQWLIREFLHAYRHTGESRYLKEAEYLTEYVLDGWDCTLDEAGNEHGGITWGPGYTTKHACSNGPFVSSLVWLHEQYVQSEEETTYRYIDADGSRKAVPVAKSDYYLKFAESVYQWQKKNLLRADGVYDDFLGGCRDCRVRYEIVDGTHYRANTPLREPVGPPYSYNTGSMLSGAVDLYRATGKKEYLDDVRRLADDSFRYFAKRDKQLTGYYSFTTSGFNNWFNGVLMRAYIEAYPLYHTAHRYIQPFQQNLDFGYTHFRHHGILPHDLLGGWGSDDHRVEGMFAFTFAAEYALLSEYALML